MAVITSGAHPKAQWPGVKAWWGKKYDEHRVEYTDLFETDSSSMAYEELVETSGFPLAQVKTGGGAIAYATDSQGAVNRATHFAVALGYNVTYEELADNLYESVSKRRAAQLAFSMRQTKEIFGANVYNDGFTGGPTFGDGVSMLNSAHPTLSGNQSNILAVAADLSEAAIEDLCTQIMDAKNSRGLRISLMPQSLHVATANWWEANRILNSVLRSDSANNDTNVLRDTGAFPKGIKVCHYFDDADAWFIRTNAQSGPCCFEREAISFEQDNDFDTMNAKARAYERYSFTFGDWRGVYGTPGA